MMLPDSIETDRLYMRRWLESDQRPFSTMNADPKVMEYYPATLSTEESNDQVARIEQHFADHRYGLWAVEIKGTTKFAGFVGLMVPRFEAHFTPCVEIGWRLAQDHWGRGYATEGAKAALDFAFQLLRLDEVVAMTTVANVRSRRVMEKIGMSCLPEDDFDHPLLEASHELSRHVLYRIKSPSFA